MNEEQYRRHCRVLKEIEENLQNIIIETKKISKIDFILIDGFRTAEEQKKLYAKGRTQPGKIVTYKDGYIKISKHQQKKAVDYVVLINNKISWNIENYKKINEIIKKISKKLKIKIRLGEEWNDYGHVELIE